ncbi:MAG: hypothetical protein FIA99_07820 [Ruminiclostridium sp.]|nr:hypothetical protein [Ruminiclostridium sp.]
MKKILSVMLIYILLMSLMIPVYADSWAKEVEVDVSASATMVDVGESVELRAIIPVHGSSFEDGWLGAEESGTTLDKDSVNYISTAVFNAVKPGKYTIEYNITMYAGKSNVVFVGKGSVTIEVIGKITVVGAAIKDLVVYSPVYKIDGSISYYPAKGTTCILWSDGSITSYGTIFFNFGAGETQKQLTFTVYVASIPYTYTVIVNR